MVIRIVKMNFHTENINTFIELFDNHKSAIRNSPGCKHLELWQDKNLESQLCTYSIWEDVESLDNYRSSELFQNIWPKTKSLFSSPPEAWSNVVKFSL